MSPPSPPGRPTRRVDAELGKVLDFVTGGSFARPQIVRHLAEGGVGDEGGVHLRSSASQGRKGFVQQSSKRNAGVVTTGSNSGPQAGAIPDHGQRGGGRLLPR